MVLHHILSCSLENLLQRRARWTNSVASSFPWYKSLKFVSRRIHKAYCLCYRSQWLPELVTTNAKWIGDESCDTLELFSQSGNHCSVLQLPVLKFKVSTSNICFKFQEIVSLNQCFRSPVFIQFFSWLIVMRRFE